MFWQERTLLVNELYCIKWTLFGKMRRDVNFSNTIVEILRKLGEKRETWCDEGRETQKKKKKIEAIPLLKLREKKNAIVAI